MTRPARVGVDALEAGMAWWAAAAWAQEAETEVVVEAAVRPVASPPRVEEPHRSAGGVFHVDTWASESAIANAGVKFGSRTAYALLGAGWVHPGGPWWTAGGGAGLHLPTRPLFVEMDASAWVVVEGLRPLDGIHGKLRTQLGLQVGPHFAPFAGVSLNGWVGSGHVWPVWVGEGPWGVSGARMAAWPGVHAGVTW